MIVNHALCCWGFPKNFAGLFYPMSGQGRVEWGREVHIFLIVSENVCESIFLFTFQTFFVTNIIVSVKRKEQTYGWKIIPGFK